MIAAPDESAKTEILRNYRDTYFTRDLLLLSNIENADGLLALLSYLGVSLGSHTEKANAGRESWLSHPTVSKYLNVIRESRLAFTLYGYHHGPAKRLIRAAKTYFADNGILTALNTPVSIGQRLENFVVSELEKRRVLGAIPADRMYYYKSAGGAEIDLIIEETPARGAGLVHAIEIKNTAKPARRDVAAVVEFVRESPKNRKGYLLYRGDSAFELDGVQVLPVAHLYRSF